MKYILGSILLFLIGCKHQPKNVGIDLSKIPSTLFLYTYEGRLIKIIDIGMPIIRLNSVLNENILYAIADAINNSSKKTLNR